MEQAVSPPRLDSLPEGDQPGRHASDVFRLLRARHLARLGRSEGSLPDRLRACVVFAALSLLRRWINAPRPYEVLKIEPLIVKNKKGNSMPSRHVASACIISMAFASLFGAWSIPFFVLSALLAFVRVIGGIHFPADAVVGAVLGILFGFILFL